MVLMKEAELERLKEERDYFQKKYEDNKKL